MKFANSVGTIYKCRIWGYYVDISEAVSRIHLRPVIKSQ